MNRTYTNDPLDALIEQHIAEARDLALHRRPVYAGIHHDFSMGFENKMAKLMGGRSEWLTRLLLIATLTILCTMSIQAGFDLPQRKITIQSQSQTEQFTFFDPAPTDQQAKDLTFAYLPNGYTLAHCDYERETYTYRFVHRSEALPSQDNHMTSLHVHAYWVGDSASSSTFHSEQPLQTETVRVNGSDALLLTYASSTYELLFAHSGFDLRVYTTQLDRNELIAFAEGISFE